MNLRIIDTLLGKIRARVCQKKSNPAQGRGTDAAHACGSWTGEQESGRALAAKCHTWGSGTDPVLSMLLS